MSEELGILRKIMSEKTYNINKLIFGGGGVCSGLVSILSDVASPLAPNILWYLSIIIILLIVLSVFVVVFSQSDSFRAKFDYYWFYPIFLTLLLSAGIFITAFIYSSSASNEGGFLASNYDFVEKMQKSLNRIEKNSRRTAEATEETAKSAGDMAEHFKEERSNPLKQAALSGFGSGLGYYIVFNALKQGQDSVVQNYKDAGIQLSRDDSEYIITEIIMSGVDVEQTFQFFSDQPPFDYNTISTKKWLSNQTVNNAIKGLTEEYKTNKENDKNIRDKEIYKVEEKKLVSAKKAVGRLITYLRKYNRQCKINKAINPGSCCFDNSVMLELIPTYDIEEIFSKSSMYNINRFNYHNAFNALVVCEEKKGEYRNKIPTPLNSFKLFASYFKDKKAFSDYPLSAKKVKTFDIYIPPVESGFSLLLIAVWSENISAVEYLLNNGSDPMRKENVDVFTSGRKSDVSVVTALSEAKRLGNEEIIKLLNY